MHNANDTNALKNHFPATFIFTVLVYCRQRSKTKAKTRDAVLITTTAILTSYVIFWCVPIAIYLCGVIFAVNRELQGRVTTLLAFGGAVFASLNPILFLWKHSMLRAYFFESISCMKSLQRHQRIVVRTVPIGEMKTLQRNPTA